MAKPMHKPPKGYEKSKFDKDKGLKEGSKADISRDKSGVKKFMASKKRAK